MCWNLYVSNPKSRVIATLFALTKGKTICAEFAILRQFLSNPDAKIVYVAPKQELCDIVRRDWDAKFGALGKKVCNKTVGLTELLLK